MTQDKNKTQSQLIAELEGLRRRVAELESVDADLKHAGEALRAKDELLQAVLDCTADGILVVDRNGRAIFTNKRYAQMWHIPPDLVEAGNDDELLEFVLNQLRDPDEFLARVRELYQSFDDDFDTLHFRDGRVFERYSRPFVEGEKLCGRVWSFREIAGDKQAKGNPKNT
jgi:two-component system, sensor histidine kinase and response regulator